MALIRSIEEGRSIFYAPERGDHKPYIQCTMSEATKHNEAGNGIHWSINAFKGPRRIENCVRVISWALEYDELPKAEQARLIRSFGLEPSLVVESKRGYQSYFDAIDGTKENYLPILRHLCRALSADINGHSLARTMRVPFHWHLKDPDDPFAVRIEYMSDARYTEREMLNFFKVKPPEEVAPRPRKTNYLKGETNLEKLDSIGATEGLKRLSGSAAVSGEMYSFRRTSRGSYNILVNAKSTSCFVDVNDRIGSGSGGGPGLIQWLMHPSYGHSKDRAWEIVMDAFPDVSWIKWKEMNHVWK